MIGTTETDIKSDDLSTTIRNSSTSITSSILTSAKWSVYLAAMATRFELDQVCPIVLKISGFHEMKVNDVRWFSDPFFTHSKGYKICLKVFANGDGSGKGTHLSIYLQIMKGLHDDELIWPLRGKLDVIVFNQLRDSGHHSWTMMYDRKIPDRIAGRVVNGDRNPGRGKQQYISFESLYQTTSTCQYLKDNCIFLQITELKELMSTY